MRTRLVTLAAASTSLVALAFVVPLLLLVDQLAEDRAVRPAELATRTLAPTAVLTDDRDVLASLVASVSADLDGHAGLLLPDGTVLGEPAPEGALAALGDSPRTVQVETPDARVVIVPVVTGGGGTAAAYAVVPRAAMERGVGTAMAVLLGLAVLLVVAAVLLADRLARRTLTALGRVESLAARLAAGDLDARADLDEDDPREIGGVARVLERLAGRIEDLLRNEREAGADLSHRLRTPLTPLRIDAESLPASPARDRVLQDVAAVEQEVDRVIRSFRGARPGVTGGTCDALAVVVDRVAFWRALAEDQGRAVDLDVPDAPPDAVRVPLAADELAESLDTLLENVFAHTPDGTALRVAVTPLDAAPGHGREVRVTVEDDGPGWPADGDPLERGATGRGSTGLGLDIAGRAAVRGGGRLVLERAPGGGAAAVLVLPLVGT